MISLAGIKVSNWPFISTPRLHLRPARVNDLPAIERALADPRFPPDRPLAQMRRESRLSSWLERMTSDASKTRLWAMTLNDAEECLGTVALVEGGTPGTWWLSYWLAPAEWRKGLAAEAVAALLDGAAERESYVQIAASVAQSNLPSMRLLQRVGFVECEPIATEQVMPEGHITMQRWLRGRGET